MTDTATLNDTAADALPAAPANKPAAAPPKMLDAQQFGREGETRNSWVATFPSEWQWDDLFSPTTWRLLAGRLRIGDVVEARSTDMRHWGQLLVVECDPSTSRVAMRELVHRELDAIDPDGMSHEGYACFYSGLQTQWCIRRIADGVVVKTGIRTRGQARAEIMVDWSKRKAT